MEFYFYLSLSSVFFDVIGVSIVVDRYRRGVFIGVQAENKVECTGLNIIELIECRRALLKHKAGLTM